MRSTLPSLPLLCAAMALLASPAQAEPKWEGAIGLLASDSPAYQGASERKLKVHPGFFLRYGRFSITNTGGFVSRSSDEVVRGVGFELVRSDAVRVSLGLRYDGGRGEDSANSLAGMGDVKNTVRARIAANWRLDEQWRVSASWNVDAFGRGGGNLGEIGLQHERRLGPHTVWTAGSSLTVAGDRYLQSYFGVSPEQAARSGYPVFETGSGLRDIAVSTGFRAEFGPRWIGLAGIGVSHLLGPAADSPLTGRTTTFGVNAGLAWRF